MLYVLLWWNLKGSRGCSTPVCSTKLMWAAWWQLNSKQRSKASETQL